jgi:hypothetical protein
MRTELSIWGATSAVNANLQQTLEPENWQKYQSASVSARYVISTLRHFISGELAFISPKLPLLILPVSTPGGIC